MRYSYKVRLVLFLHLCGTNLIQVWAHHGSKVHQDGSDITIVDTVGDNCQDHFPSEAHFGMPLNFSLSERPFNMTDCRLSDHFSVVCDSLSWTSVDLDQIPLQMRSLRINSTSLSDLKEGQFKTRLIFALDLSDNHCLTSLNPASLDGLTSLFSLTLRNNSRLSHNTTNNDAMFFQTFHPLTSLWYLLLEDNTDLILEAVDSKSTSNKSVLHDLRYLSLKGSDIRRLEADIFWPLRASNDLAEVNLQNCNLTSIASTAFDHLPHVKHIDFYKNPKLLMPSLRSPFWTSMLYLPETGFESLGLAFNDLIFMPYLLSYLVRGSLRRLNLSGNMFPNLGSLGHALDMPSLPSMPLLDSLILRYCFIEAVHMNTFMSLPLLKLLDLGGNRLTKVPPGVLKDGLQILDLSSQCQDLDDPCFNLKFEITEGIFEVANMTGLRELSLSNNHFEGLQRASFNGLSGLQTLHLVNTDLERLEACVFCPLANIRHLDLSMNKRLHGLTNPVLSGLHKLEYLNLAYSSKVFTTDHLGLTRPSLNLERLRVLNLTCALNEDCGASFDYESPLDENLLKALSSLEVLDLSENALAPWADDRFVVNVNLTSLSLRSNQMVFISEGMLRSFSRLASLDFRDNPVRCEFNVVQFVKMTLEYPQLEVVGWDNGTGYYCHKEDDLEQTMTFWDYYEAYEEEEEASNDYMMTSVLLLIMATGGLISVVTGYYMFRQRYFISYYILTRKKATSSSSLQRSRPQDYDVFVSYCQEDQEWVSKQLLRRLEDDLTLKCCVHERDFEVGLTVIQNIVDCVDRCKAFLVVLSPSYIKSKWCMFELHLAQSRMLANDGLYGSDVVVVVKEHVASKKLDNNLRYMLQMWTYIEWPNKDTHHEQRLFWKRISARLEAVKSIA